MVYKYVYISKRTSDKKKIPLSKLPSAQITRQYKLIKKTNDRCGIFLYDKDKNELVGYASVLKQDENGVKFLLIDYVYIDKNHRGKNQCYELVKRLVLKIKKKDVLIKVVIAGGWPVLNCVLRVFREQNYNILKYKSDKKEDINKLKSITFEDAVKIEKRNSKYDTWQSLFFKNN